MKKLNTYKIFREIKEISEILETLSKVQNNLHASGPDDSLKKLRTYNLMLIDLLGEITAEHFYHPEQIPMVEKNEGITCSSGEDIWKDCEQK